MAAQQHGVTEAARLLADLETAYQATWEGHADARAAADAVTAEVATWRTESAAASARAAQAGINAAVRLGETSDVLARSFVADSVAAKQAAYLESVQTGTPYRDPVGPGPVPATVNPPAPDEGGAVV